MQLPWADFFTEGGPGVVQEKHLWNAQQETGGAENVSSLKEAGGLCGEAEQGIILSVRRPENTHVLKNKTEGSHTEKFQNSFHYINSGYLLRQTLQSPLVAFTAMMDVDVLQ